MKSIQVILFLPVAGLIFITRKSVKKKAKYNRVLEKSILVELLVRSEVDQTFFEFM
jgi:hypothetical protein